MITTKRHRVLALVAAHMLFAAVLAFVSTARAEDITYNINNYPLSQSDMVHVGTDTVSGWITTDGSIGTLTDADIISYGFRIDYPGGYVSQGGGTNATSYLENVQATPTELLCPTPLENAWLALGLGDGDMTLQWGLGKEYWGKVQTYNSEAQQWNTIAEFSDTGGETAPGYICANEPMIIATAVPEPGTLTLLVSALLGLAGAGYLRRRAKA